MSHLCSLAYHWQNSCVFSEMWDQDLMHALWEGLKICVFPQTQYCQYFFLFLHLSPRLSVREIYTHMHIFYFTGICTLFQCQYVNLSFKKYLPIGRHLPIWGQTTSLSVQREVLRCHGRRSALLSACISGKVGSKHNLAIIWKASVCLQKLREGEFLLTPYWHQVDWDVHGFRHGI